MARTIDAALRKAFMDVTYSVAGVLEVFNADAEMINAISGAMNKAFIKNLNENRQAGKKDVSDSMTRLINSLKNGSGRPTR